MTVFPPEAAVQVGTMDFRFPGEAQHCLKSQPLLADALLPAFLGTVGEAADRLQSLRREGIAAVGAIEGIFTQEKPHRRSAEGCSVVRLGQEGVVGVLQQFQQGTPPVVIADPRLAAGILAQSLRLVLVGGEGSLTEIRQPGLPVDKRFYLCIP